MENFERALAITHTDPRVLIIRLRWVPFIDITGLQTLEEVILDLHKRGVRVMLSGANARVEAKLEKAHIIDLVGRANLFGAFPDALAFCRQLAQADAAMANSASVRLSQDMDALRPAAPEPAAPEPAGQQVESQK